MNCDLDIYWRDIKEQLIILAPLLNLFNNLFPRLWADAVFSALRQAEYSELVETLLSSQRDAVIYQRLADAFNKLTASSTPPTMDRKQKVAFLKSLEEFVANVGGLLCVK